MTHLDDPSCIHCQDNFSRVLGSMSAQEIASYVSTCYEAERQFVLEYVASNPDPRFQDAFYTLTSNPSLLDIEEPAIEE